jgi:hypothetical protein
LPYDNDQSEKQEAPIFPAWNEKSGAAAAKARIAIAGIHAGIHARSRRKGAIFGGICFGLEKNDYFCTQFLEIYFLLSL